MNLTWTPLEQRLRHMADREGPLSPRDRTRIARQVAERQAAMRISNQQTGRILGCSGSTWSLIRRGKYAGDADRYLRRARAWLDHQETARPLPLTPYVPTSIGEQIIAICELAVELPTIGLVVTPAGVGKTFALLEFARRMGERAVMVQAGEALNTKRYLIEEIAAKMGIGVGTRESTGAIYVKVRDRIAGVYAGGGGEPVVLIVDEATNLQASAINMLRNLHDDVAARAVVILADTGRIDERLAGRRGIAGGYEQLTRRCKAQMRMGFNEEIVAEDCRKVAASVIESVDGPRLNRDAMSYLHAAAQEPGKLANVASLIQMVHRMAQRTNTEATYTVAQLDYIAPAVGLAQRMPDMPCPFGRAGARMMANVRQQGLGTREQEEAAA